MDKQIERWMDRLMHTLMDGWTPMETWRVDGHSDYITRRHEVEKKKSKNNLLIQ